LSSFCDDGLRLLLGGQQALDAILTWWHLHLGVALGRFAACDA
jgi:hypothetical protein